VSIHFKFIFAFYLLNFLGGCKQTADKPEESNLESIGYRKWALLFHEIDEKGEPKPYYKKKHPEDPDAYKGKKFIFALCQRVAPSYKTILYNKTATQPGCVSALKRKDDPTEDLVFEVSVEKLDGKQRSNWIKLQGEKLLDHLLSLGQYAGAIVITTVPVVAVGTPTAVITAPAGGVGGFVAGAAVLVWSAAKGIAWASMFHVVRGQSTYKWSETDRAASIYFKHIFQLDDGKEIENLIRRNGRDPSKQFGYILNWLATNFDGKVSKEFTDASNDVAGGDPFAFD
jgi:hypothetical protein